MTSGVPAFVCLFLLAVNNVVAMLCCNDFVVGVALMNAWWLPREENAWWRRHDVGGVATTITKRIIRVDEKNESIVMTAKNSNATSQAKKS